MSRANSLLLWRHYSQNDANTKSALAYCSFLVSAEINLDLTGLDSDRDYSFHAPHPKQSFFYFYQVTCARANGRTSSMKWLSTAYNATRSKTRLAQEPFGYVSECQSRLQYSSPHSTWSSACAADSVDGWLRLWSGPQFCTADRTAAGHSPPPAQSAISGYSLDWNDHYDDKKVKTCSKY